MNHDPLAFVREAGYLPVVMRPVLKIPCCLFFLIAVLALASHDVRAEDELVVGAVFGLSGSVAQYGQWAQRGVQLAVEEINQAKGVRGRPIRVRYEDSQGQPASAVAAFKKLLDIDRVQYFLTCLSSVALAIAPLANRAHVIQMDVSAFTPQYSSPDDYTFRTGVLAVQLSSGLARSMFDELKVSRVAVLYIENEKGQAGYESFRESFGGSIVLAESFRPNESDYRSLLLKIRALNVKDIFLSGHLHESGLLLKQARELGLRLRVFSDVYSVEGRDFLEAAGEASDGVIYATPLFAADSRIPRMARFYREYQGRFHEAPTYFSAQAYDGVIALAAALEKCQVSQPICVKDELHNLQLEGASGPIHFDRNGDIVDKTIALKTIRDRQFVDYTK